MIEVRCLHELADAAPWRAELDALCASAERPDPFSTLTFQENFLERDEFREQDRERELWLVCVFDGDAPIGYLPLRRRVERVFGQRVRVLTQLATHDSDRPQLVHRPGDGPRVRDAILGWLAARKGEWEMLSLVQQDPASPLAQVARVPGCYVRHLPGRDNATIHLRWPDLREFHASLSKKMRNNTRRALRALLGASELSYLCTSHPGGAAQLLDAYRFVESHAWKASAHAGIARSEARLHYLRGLLEPGHPMRLSISALLLGGVPVGALISSLYSRRAFALEICYDARLAAHGVGTAMLLMGVREAIARGAESYNLMSSFSYYKRHWGADIRPTVNVEIFRPFSAVFAKAMLGDLKRRLFSPAAGPADFNAARRASDEEEPADRGGALPLLASDEERARMGDVVTAVRASGAEYLDGAALRAAMPLSDAPRRAVAS